MKRLIHATLALSLSISASAKSQTRTPHPYVEDPQTISISIDEISTGNDTTALKIHAYCPPGNWIRMSRDTYLDADGKRYPLIGSKGIEPGEKLRMGASGDSIFTMYFQALPSTTVKFDLMEGTSNDDFKLKGIHTDRSFDTDQPTYDMSLLPVPKFEKGTFTLTGKIKNYDPTGDVTTVMVYPRCALGRSIKADSNIGQIDTDGTFSLSIEINQNPQPCFINLPGYYGLAYFTPGEEATIEIDAAKRWHNGFHGERGSVEFGGTYGDINQQLATIYGHDMVWDSFANNMPRGKKYTDVEAIKDDILRHSRHRIAKLHHLPLSDKAKAFFKIEIDADIINQLNYTPFVMRIQGIPASYYTYYKEFGFDSPMMMWSSDYDTAIGNLGLISIGQNSTTINTPPASHFQKLIDSGALREDEVKLARTLMRYPPENNLSEEEESFLKENADALSAFYTRHGKALQDLKFIHDIDKSISKFRNITGIEDHTLEALMANHKYNNYIDSRNTLPEAYIADAKTRLPQYVFDHLMAKNAEMDQILNKATFNVLEASPSDDCEKILADIAAKHKGKVLYIDIWAVWCGPCIHAISEIQPAKKDYADKVAFVYLADESSPKDTWSEKIKSIDGDHYRLSQAQMQSVMSRFGFDSYPSYIVIGKNGDISYSGFIHGLDNIKKLLDRETNK